MATRSIIAYEHPDTGNIYAVYCHYDGYLEHNGMILHALYNQAGKVKQLILRGGMRNLYTNNLPSIEIPDRPITGVPDYYARTKEEYKSEDPACLSDVYALYEYADNSGAEFVYLFKDNDWLVAFTCSSNTSFKYLKECLQHELGGNFDAEYRKFHDSAPFWLQMESPLWD